MKKVKSEVQGKQRAIESKKGADRRRAPEQRKKEVATAEA
jgi:hypothetical protein